MSVNTRLTKNPKDILLGEGVFYINEVPIGLTRGGGQFVVEREIRQIEADGDRGIIKGRSVIDKVVPKLTINALEVIGENLTKMYSGIQVADEDGKKKLTGKGKITDDDYQATVSFVGQTKGGREVVIVVENAINLENLDWSLVDKDEVVASLTYTGCYAEDSPAGYEPWSITYAE